MRRLLPLSALAALVLLLVACGGGTGGPGWTLGPSPATPPPASASASAGPSGSVTPSATAQPSASVQPSPSASGGATTVALTASPTLKFDQTQLSAPAGAPFTITFDNQDAGQVHNVEIKDPAGATVFRGDTVTGPGQISYQVPALAAGSYPFNCTVHPAMTGTITAG